MNKTAKHTNKVINISENTIRSANKLSKALNKDTNTEDKLDKYAMNTLVGIICFLSGVVLSGIIFNYVK